MCFSVPLDLFSPESRTKIIESQGNFDCSIGEHPETKRFKYLICIYLCVSVFYSFSWVWKYIEFQKRSVLSRMGEEGVSSEIQ
jgi:hypothetical protein